MMDILKKAEELGDLIVASPQAQKLKKVTEEFNQNSESKEKFDKMRGFRDTLIQSIEEGRLSEEETQKANSQLAMMQNDLRTDTYITAVIEAEEEYNVFIDQVMVAMESKIMSQGVLANDGCSSGCGGCGCGGGC